MDRSQFINFIIEGYTLGVELIQRKNADYATGSDPFQNFYSATVVGVAPDRAILVRILDKLSRVANLLDKKNAVLDESIEDTILDAINYLAILRAFLHDKKQKHGQDKTLLDTVVEKGIPEKSDPSAAQG